MAEKENLITAEGKAKLEEELEYLENVKRVEVGERIKVARDFGDISENSEYDDAKNEQGMMEARISEINRILANSVIVDTPKRGSKVAIGSTVLVKNEAGKERSITIVGSAESDPENGKISNEAPVGAALVGHKKGDVVHVVGPTGRKVNFEILKVTH